MIADLTNRRFNRLVVERLERDRDALAERCEKLREALRGVAIVQYHETIPHESFCSVCENVWNRSKSEPEHHAPGCLAAPKDAP